MALGLLASGVALADDSVECPRAKQAASLLVDIRANIRTNPAVAMAQLGVAVDDFEPIAKALYYKWLEKHPEGRPRTPAQSPPAVAPVVVAPTPVPADSSGPLDNVSWWCFSRADLTIGDCKTTKERCEASRSRFLNPAGPDRSSCPPGSTPQECDRVRLDVIARLQDIEPCEHQDRAACFRVRNVLSGGDGTSCSPTIKMCKQRRSFTRKDQADDVRVLSECSVEN